MCVKYYLKKLLKCLAFSSNSYYFHCFDNNTYKYLILVPIIKLLYIL